MEGGGREGVEGGGGGHCTKIQLAELQTCICIYTMSR